MIRCCKIIIALVLLITMSSPAIAGGESAYIYYSSAGENADKLTRAGVICENIEGLRGFQVRILFDSTIVQVEDADLSTAGIQVALGSMFKDALVAVNRVDNTKGEIFISAAKPGYQVTGTTDLVWFDLKGIKSGNPKLVIADGGVVIVDKRMQEIKLSADSGVLSVPNAGAPPLVERQTMKVKPLLRTTVDKVTDSSVAKSVKAETGKKAGIDSSRDRTGQVLTIIGGIVLAGLIAYHFYTRKRKRRRRHRM
jgi:hypothetical protein